MSIFASNTELLAALGLVDRIVGIESFTRYPPEVMGRPLVGGRLGFSVDAIVGLRPDLVVMTPARQATYQLLDPMQRLDIPVLVVLARTVDEVLSNIRLFARAAPHFPFPICNRTVIRRRACAAPAIFWRRAA